MNILVATNLAQFVQFLTTIYLPSPAVPTANVPATFSTEIKYRNVFEFI